MVKNLEEIRRQLTPGHRLRAALNFGNPVLAQRGEGSDGPRGVTVSLARELGRRLERPVEFVHFESAAQVVAAAPEGRWDVGFLAADPERARAIDFTEPYVLLEGTYLVRANAPLHEIADFDHAGTRIAVGRGAAYDLHLSRSLRHAQLVRAETSGAAVQLFVDQELEAAAGVRQPLEAYAAANAGYRVLDGSFHTITQAMGVPVGRPAAHAYLCTFIEEMKRAGFVARALAGAA